MNNRFLIVNALIPFIVIILIVVCERCFGIRKKESIKSDLFEYFKKVWEASENGSGSDEKDSFFQKFFGMFIQTYEYEKYKEDNNKHRYYFFKLVDLFIVLCIPFLTLYLLYVKEEYFKQSEWNDTYLYVVILVPLIFVYLLNKYIRVRQYYETWYRHLRNRHQMEWRMLEFIKNYELKMAGVKSEESGAINESLKIDFINDMCEYWKTTSSEIAVPTSPKDENIFAEFSSLFK